MLERRAAPSHPLALSVNGRCAQLTALHNFQFNQLPRRGETAMFDGHAHRKNLEGQPRLPRHRARLKYAGRHFTRLGV